MRLENIVVLKANKNTISRLWRKIMNKTLSLMSLVNRIKFDQEQIKIHPENANMLKRHMEKQKEYLVELCLENAYNPLLEQITI